MEDALYQFDGTTQVSVADVGSGDESLVGGQFIAYGEQATVLYGLLNR